MDTKRLVRPTWVEIDLDAVGNNVTEFKRILGDKVTILGVMKAHGYGHGLIPIAKYLIKHGIPILCVGNLYEGISLRKAGIKEPIQVFGSYLPEAANSFVDYNLMPTFFSPENPGQFAEMIGSKTPLKVWIKVETGLGRLGVFPDQVFEMIRKIKENTVYQVEGIFSHIGARAQSASENDKAYCEGQWKVFNKLMNDLELQGTKIPYYQIASTHATIAMPHTWANCVSIANGLYSDEGPADPKIKIHLQPAYSALRSKLISIKKFNAGDQIGGYVLGRNSLIGVAPVGLGDGLSGKNTGNDVLVKGVRSKILGSVSFEHIRIDVTEVPNVTTGDVVTIMGKDGEDEIKLKEICTRTGVSSAQFWSAMNMSTVPYLFMENKKIVDIEIKS
jgi:alanine racemase